VIRFLLNLSALFLFLGGNLCAQELFWKAGFNGFFDNREYYNPYAQPQSIFGARTFVEGGIKLDNNNEFGAGVDFMYEFGSAASIKNLDPILYYHYSSEQTSLYMGAFQRHQLVNLPLVLQSDTFNYYRPQLEGVLISFKNDWGSQKAWIDWTSRQTLENHESFLVGLTGEAKKGMLFARYDFLMYHYAGTAAEGPSIIRDNGGIVAVTGLNLTKFTPLDSLSISSGFVGSYDRLRTYYDLRYYYGNISEVYAKYKTFGLRSMLYVGDGQIQMVGDKMYKSPVYNRTDLIFNFLRKGRVSGNFEFSFHFIPGITDFSQKFTIYIDVSGNKKL
jgi:hypothetical protein